MGFGLSGKLLLLTIPLILIVEILIYVPSIANFRVNRLNDRLAAASTAAPSVARATRSTALFCINAQFWRHGVAAGGQNARMQPRLAATPAVAMALLACGPLTVAQEADHARIERGRALLAQYQCGSCHTIPGVHASRGQVAQSLAGWRHRSYIAGRLPNRPEMLARWIAAPQALVPGTAMPAMGVAPADAEAMAAYLFTLR